jgi:phage gp29-like protein
MDNGSSERLASLIAKAVKAPSNKSNNITLTTNANNTSTLFEVDQQVLNEVLQYTLTQNAGNMVTEVLMRHLKTNKSAVTKMKSLKIIDFLFQNDSQFRRIFSSSQILRELLVSCGVLHASDHHAQTSSSASVAIRLAESFGEQVKDRALQLIERWDVKYGLQCPAIRAMKRYLVESLRISMPDVLVSG